MLRTGNRVRNYKGQDRAKVNRRSKFEDSTFSSGSVIDDKKGLRDYYKNHTKE